MAKITPDILILENDAMVSQILAECVQSIAGVRLEGSCGLISELPATSGKLLLVLGETSLPDGRLADWILKKRALGEPVDFLPVTGDTRVSTYLLCRSLGACDYILKPFQRDRVQLALMHYREQRNRFSPDAVLTQRLLDGPPALGAAEEPFRGSPVTMERLQAFIRSLTVDSFSAEEAATAIGVAKGTARRYLTVLQERGSIAVLSEYGHIGRPAYRYRVVNKEEST